MKKVLSSVMTGVMIISGLLSFGGCSAKDEEAGGSGSSSNSNMTREFFFSTDNGATYGNSRVEFPVGESIYMKVVVNIDSEADTINGTLSIPDIQAVDAYYLKGQQITPEIDLAEEMTTYPFEITPNEEWAFVFEFIPNSEGRLEMSLSFDDSVPARYDMVNTIIIVEDSEDLEDEVVDVEDDD